MRLRAITKLKNDHIMAELDKRGWNQSELARQTGLSSWTVGYACNLNYETFDEDDAIKIATALEIPVDLVFPPELAGKKIASKRVQVAEVSATALLAMHAEERLLLADPAETTEEDDEREYEMLMVRTAMNRLSFRERMAYERSTGLYDGAEWGPTRIARDFGVSVERARQITNKARRKMQAYMETMKTQRESGLLVRRGDTIEGLVFDGQLDENNKIVSERTALRERKGRG